MRIPTNTFDITYLDISIDQFNSTETQMEVEFLCSIIGQDKGLQVLDLACGFGRHAIPLAKKYYNISALDSSKVLLNKARELAKSEHVEIKLYENDMRHLDFKKSFDFVYNVFSSLFFFENDVNVKVTKQIGQALKMSGRFFLDTINPIWFIRHADSKFWNGSANGPWVLEEPVYDVSTGVLTAKRLVIYPDGKTHKRNYSLRLYTLPEVEKLFSDAGLKIEKTYGGVDGSSYNGSSSRMIVLAKKIRD